MKIGSDAAQVGHAPPPAAGAPTVVCLDTTMNDQGFGGSILLTARITLSTTRSAVLAYRLILVEAAGRHPGISPDQLAASGTDEGERAQDRQRLARVPPSDRHTPRSADDRDPRDL